MRARSQLATVVLLAGCDAAADPDLASVLEAHDRLQGQVELLANKVADLEDQLGQRPTRDEVLTLIPPAAQGGLTEQQVRDLLDALGVLRGDDASDFARRSEFVDYDGVRALTASDVALEGSRDQAIVRASDLAPYAKTADLPGDVDLSAYATTADLAAYTRTTDLPDLSPYAKTDDLAAYALLTDLPDLAPYALLTDLPDLAPYALLADLPDLSPYARTEDLPDLTPYATTLDLDAYALLTDLPDLSPYALLSDLPDLSPYALTTDLSDLATRDYVDQIAVTPESGPRWVIESTTWSIGDGGDFDTLDEALDALDAVRLTADAWLTLQLLPGTYALTGTVELFHFDGARIRLVGDRAAPETVVVTVPPNVDAFRITGPGHWGGLDGMTIRGASARGGTAVVVAQGARAVLGGKLVLANLDIGIEVDGAAHVWAPGGVVVDDANNGAVARHGTYLDVQSARLSNLVGNGVSSVYGADVHAQRVQVDTATRGFNVDWGGFLFGRDATITRAGYAGVEVGHASAGEFQRTTIADSGRGALVRNHGYAHLSSTTLTDNGTGVEAHNGGAVVVNALDATDQARSIYAYDGAQVWVGTVTATRPSGSAIQAQSGARVQVGELVATDVDGTAIVAQTDSAVFLDDATIDGAEGVAEVSGGARVAFLARGGGNQRPEFRNVARDAFEVGFDGVVHAPNALFETIGRAGVDLVHHARADVERADFVGLGEQAIRARHGSFVRADNTSVEDALSGVWSSDASVAVAHNAQMTGLSGPLEALVVLDGAFLDGRYGTFETAAATGAIGLRGATVQLDDARVVGATTDVRVADASWAFIDDADIATIDPAPIGVDPSVIRD